MDLSSSFDNNAVQPLVEDEPATKSKRWSWLAFVSSSTSSSSPRPLINLDYRDYEAPSPATQEIEFDTSNNQNDNVEDDVSTSSLLSNSSHDEEKGNFWDLLRNLEERAAAPSMEPDEDWEDGLLLEEPALERHESTGGISMMQQFLEQARQTRVATTRKQRVLVTSSILLGAVAAAHFLSYASADSQDGNGGSPRWGWFGFP